MAKLLPLFPLNLVVYPGERLRLYIFEARYQQLINESLAENNHFGIPVVIDKKVAEIATEVRVVSVDKKFPGGEMNITTEGLRRVQVEQFFQEVEGKLYPGGYVNGLPQSDDTPLSLQEEVFQLIEELHNALGITKRFADAPIGITSYKIGHHVGLNLKQEYELLVFDEERQRMEYIRDHLKRILPVVVETEKLKSKAKLNGHFKHIVPPDY